VAGVGQGGGGGGEAGGGRAPAGELAHAIETRLWDDDLEAYQDRRLDGRFTGMLSPACFLPAEAGIGDVARHRRMCQRWLLSPDHFNTPMPFPTVDRAHVAFKSGGTVHPHPDYPGALVQDAYWTGRSWPRLWPWMVAALQRCGLTSDADALARRCLDELDRHESLYECYDALTGNPTGHAEFPCAGATAIELAYGWYREV
jgi:glycogen debranching enzyme